MIEHSAFSTWVCCKLQRGMNSLLTTAGKRKLTNHEINFHNFYYLYEG